MNYWMLTNFCLACNVSISIGKESSVASGLEQLCYWAPLVDARFSPSCCYWLLFWSVHCRTSSVHRYSEAPEKVWGRIEIVGGIVGWPALNWRGSAAVAGVLWSHILIWENNYAKYLFNFIITNFTFLPQKQLKAGCGMLMVTFGSSSCLQYWSWGVLVTHRDSVLVKHKFNICSIFHGLSLSLQGELLVHLNQYKEAADVFQKIIKTRYVLLYLLIWMWYLTSPAE